jgi:hypothetical protein
MRDSLISPQMSSAASSKTEVCTCAVDDRSPDTATQVRVSRHTSKPETRDARRLARARDFEGEGRAASHQGPLLGNGQPKVAQLKQIAFAAGLCAHSAHSRFAREPPSASNVSNEIGSVEVMFEKCKTVQCCASTCAPQHG